MQATASETEEMHVLSENHQRLGTWTVSRIVSRKSTPDWLRPRRHKRLFLWQRLSCRLGTRYTSRTSDRIENWSKGSTWDRLSRIADEIGPCMQVSHLHNCSIFLSKLQLHATLRISQIIATKHVIGPELLFCSSQGQTFVHCHV